MAFGGSLVTRLRQKFGKNVGHGFVQSHLSVLLDQPVVKLVGIRVGDFINKDTGDILITVHRIEKRLIQLAAPETRNNASKQRFPSLANFLTWAATAES